MFNISLFNSSSKHVYFIQKNKRIRNVFFDNIFYINLNGTEYPGCSGCIIDNPVALYAPSFVGSTDLLNILSRLITSN